MTTPQLFLLHFAGGSVYSYQFLKPFLHEFECVPLELPGRGKRIKEPLLTDFNNAVQDIYQQVQFHLRAGPFLIYGHSMGSLMALEVARLLESCNKPPAGIIVSGNAGPGTDDRKKRYLMEPEAFKMELRKIGGVSEELMANEELFDFFIPMLKADFEIVEKEEAFPIFSAVRSPIFAIMGNREEYADKIANWKHFTASDFEYTILEGDHFFIYDRARELADIIKACYLNNSIPLKKMQA